MERFQDAGFLQTLFDAVPAFMFIIDRDGRVHHLNAAAMRLVGMERGEILLKRGGEVLQCVHSFETPEGCGFAPACRDCVIRGAARRVFSKGERVSRQTTEMQLVEGGEARQVYLSVTAAPFCYLGEDLALLILEDVTAQKRAEEAVQRSERWLSTTLTSIGDAVVATDNEGRITFMNPVAEGLMGWRLAEVRNESLTEIFRIINKNTGKPVENPVEKVLAKGASAGLANHTVLIARDGTEVPIDDSAAPIKNDNGDILGVILVFRDVTERERAEGELRESEAGLRAALLEKETLLKELYHRTKNNMNVISSLLAIGERRAAGDPKAACPFKEMQTRIQAMALVHEKLYKSQDLHNLDIREYIEDLARSIHSGFKSEGKKISLELDLESIPFPLDQAIPCGLIINELMSNALKYAFAGREKGRIGISLHADGGDAIEIVFSDDGVGLPDGLDVKGAKSLGMKIIHILVHTQLEGEMEWESGGRGTAYRIRFGLSHSS